MSRQIRLAGLVARMGETRNTYRVLVGKSERKDSWEDIDIDGRIMLKWILEN
jgi:hypothetical protein